MVSWKLSRHSKFTKMRFLAPTKTSKQWGLSTVQIACLLRQRIQGAPEHQEHRVTVELRERVAHDVWEAALVEISSWPKALRRMMAVHLQGTDQQLEEGNPNGYSKSQKRWMIDWTYWRTWWTSWLTRLERRKERRNVLRILWTMQLSNVRKLSTGLIQNRHSSTNSNHTCQEDRATSQNSLLNSMTNLRMIN